MSAHKDYLREGKTSSDGAPTRKATPAGGLLSDFSSIADIYFANSFSSHGLVDLLRTYWNRGGEAESFRKLLKILGQPLRADVTIHSRRARRLSAEEKRQLLADYEAGVLVRDIALKFGVHRITVTNLVRAAGQKPRFRGLEERAVKQASRLYEDGWSLARLAKRYGVTLMTVRHYLLKEGVQMRPRPGWTT